MPALLRVCRNVLRRAWPQMLWFILALLIVKIWMINPWKARVADLTHQVNQLYQKLAEKEDGLSKACENQTQTAIEKERTQIQTMIDAAITALEQKQQAMVASTKTTPTEIKPENNTTSPTTASELEKAWPEIERRHKQCQPWTDALPSGQTPEACLQAKSAHTQDQLIKECQNAEDALDSTPQDTPKSWWSSLIKVRRLDSIGNYTTEVVDMIEKEAWQDAIAHLESHPNKENSKIKSLIQNLKDRFSYEQAFVQLTTWKKQQCAISVP